MKVDDQQRYLMITEAAYFLAERRNFEPGYEHEDWQAAERQVDEMLKAMAQQPAFEQRIEAGERAQPVRNAKAVKPAERTTTTLAESKPSPRGKQALTQGRQTTKSNQAPARATTVKAKPATRGHKATTVKQSVAAGAIPSEAVPQPTSATGEQPEVNAKAPAKRTRRSTRTEQATPMPMAAASQEERKPAPKPRQKKVEKSTVTKGDGRRRSKTTSV